MPLRAKSSVKIAKKKKLITLTVMQTDCKNSKNIKKSLAYAEKLALEETLG